MFELQIDVFQKDITKAAEIVRSIEKAESIDDDDDDEE
jgi:hypothetical protein